MGEVGHLPILWKMGLAIISKGCVLLETALEDIGETFNNRRF